MVEQVIELITGRKINVHYQMGQKETVVFLHFSGGTLQMWNGVIPIFENEYKIVAPDITGHGKSDKPLTGYHIDEMAHDLYLLLQKLEIQSCHIVGSSMGAEIGLSMAAAHPELVTSLVCEGALYNEFGEFGLFNGTKQEIESEKERLLLQLTERNQPFYESKQVFINEIKENLTEQGFWNESFRIYFESSLEETEQGFTSHYKNFVRNEYMKNYWELRFEEYYKNVKCPVLFLPSKDELENEKIQTSFRTFRSFLDTYEIANIENSSHAFVWMQYPKIAGEVVKNFISKYC